MTTCRVDICCVLGFTWYRSFVWYCFWRFIFLTAIFCITIIFLSCSPVGWNFFRSIEFLVDAAACGDFTFTLLPVFSISVYGSGKYTRVYQVSHLVCLSLASLDHPELCWNFQHVFSCLHTILIFFSFLHLDCGLSNWSLVKSAAEFVYEIFYQTVAWLDYVLSIDYVARYASLSEFDLASPCLKLSLFSFFLAMTDFVFPILRWLVFIAEFFLYTLFLYFS